jgi:hypothetical protein
MSEATTMTPLAALLQRRPDVKAFPGRRGEQGRPAAAPAAAVPFAAVLGFAIPPFAGK